MNWGRRSVLCLTLMVCVSLKGWTQTRYWPIQVTQEGIFQLPASEISKITENPENLALFGHPGPLDQKLEEQALQLQQIPIHERNGAFFFFLSGPDRWEFDGENWSQKPHLGSDTLTYYLGTASDPLRIESLMPAETEGSEALFYRWHSQRPRALNLLNSGREWFGQAIASGADQRFTFQVASQIDAPWLLRAGLMAQSFASSEMQIWSGGRSLSSTSFSPIPDATYGLKGRKGLVNNFFTPSEQRVQELEVRYTASAANSAGYVEYLHLGIPGSSFDLSDGIWYREETEAVSILRTAEQEYWLIDDFYTPKRLDFQLEAAISAQRLAVFEWDAVPSLSLGQEVQLNLRTHQSNTQLIIITHGSLLGEARRLASHKESLGISTEVVDVDKVFQDFAYGNRDIVGIRNFIASRYHSGSGLRNVLILGKGTFDYRGRLGGRPNLVPIYTSRESLNPLTTFSSDDFFGLLDFGQGEWIENREGDEEMQIGVGRLPVISVREAQAVVDKIIAYELHPAPGDWKRTVTFFADDADNNIHMRDAEAHSEFLFKNHRSYFQNKLYLDRYEQTNSGSGQQSEQAEQALRETLDQGTLFLNYIGHGNETTLTAEEVFQAEDIRSWPEQETLPLWVTATCEFGRHDSPFVRSAAEELLVAPKKGAIGLLTTGRPVFSSVNFRLNEAFIEEVFRDSERQIKDLGSVFRQTKNKSLNGALNRNFALLGDPSMKLADPELEIQITALENAQTDTPTDTLAAFQQIRLNAQVIDPLTGAVQRNFNGDFLLDLRDKPLLTKTLGDENSPFEFREEKGLLFRGSGNIAEGELEANFLISSNIQYDFGNGSLRLIGRKEDGTAEAIGGLAPIIGGSGPLSEDKEGPVIRAFFEGQKDPVSPFPSTQIILDIELEDQSGINVSGIAPGQNLQIQVNGQPPIVVNHLFLAQDGNFTAGKLSVNLTGLQEGANEIRIIAWDNVGNESSFVRNIEVFGSEHIQILEYLVFPNPASEESNFSLTHNRPGENLRLSLMVYDMGGHILFTESQRLEGVNSRIEGIKWIFLQSQTKYPAKGTYIYNLSLLSELDNTKASVSGKIIIE